MERGNARRVSHIQLGWDQIFVTQFSCGNLCFLQRARCQNYRKALFGKLTADLFADASISPGY
jgi:hypothetical protein